MTGKKYYKYYVILGALLIVAGLAPILFTGTWSYTKFSSYTGPIGDTIGGLTSPFMSLIGSILVFLALKAQIEANNQVQKQISGQDKKDAINKVESNFFELIKLHRENLAEMEYSKFHNGELKAGKSRKVFRMISEEFIECLQETKKFYKAYKNEIEIVAPEYKINLEKILRKNFCRETVENIACIDIAYCMLFFGLSKETDTILMHKFYNRYNSTFIRKLKKFLQLKPKPENVLHFKNWENFKNFEKNQIKNIIEEICMNRPLSDKSEVCQALCKNYELDYYYNGHQHRLSHYFRNLFQAFRYLSNDSLLNKNQKYFLAKTLRSQLSTYEQLMLFVNSLSSLGMTWEYDLSEKSLRLVSKKKRSEFRLITRYNLVKNLPGSQYYDIVFRKYYPNVNYEYMEDITYRRENVRKTPQSTDEQTNA